MKGTPSQPPPRVPVAPPNNFVGYTEAFLTEIRSSNSGNMYLYSNHVVCCLLICKLTCVGLDWISRKCSNLATTCPEEKSSTERSPGQVWTAETTLIAGRDLISLPGGPKCRLYQQHHIVALQSRVSTTTCHLCTGAATMTKRAVLKFYHNVHNTFEYGPRAPGMTK